MIKRITLSVIFIFFFFIIQLTIFPLFISSYLRPDFIMIIAVYFAIRNNKFFLNGFNCFSLGLVQDFFSSFPLGFFALSKFIIFLIARSIKSRFLFSPLILGTTLVIIATLVEGGISLALFSLKNKTDGLIFFLEKAFIYQPLINGSIAFLFFFSIHYLNLVKPLKGFSYH